MSQQVVACSYNNEKALFQAYMPFIKSGGLFVRTKSTFVLGSEVDLQISLYGYNDVITVVGKVVWITPKGAQGNKPTGIGVQFLGDNKDFVKNTIETLLTGKLKHTQPTDTM